MSNPVVGTCTCPLCAADGAEVRQGAKGALYIVCDECVSQVRTMSRKGRARIQALTASAPAPAAVEKTAAPAAGNGTPESEGKPADAAGPAAKAPPATSWPSMFGVG